MTVIALRKFMSSTFLEISGGIDLLSDMRVHSRTVIRKLCTPVSHVIFWTLISALHCNITTLFKCQCL